MNKPWVERPRTRSCYSRSYMPLFYPSRMICVCEYCFKMTMRVLHANVVFQCGYDRVCWVVVHGIMCRNGVLYVSDLVIATMHVVLMPECCIL